jgi:hypothetical protein
VCKDLVIRNNWVAGAVWAGMTLPAHACGGSNENRRNNTVHSVRFEKHGSAFAVYPDASDPSQNGPNGCIEASDLRAYKSMAGVVVGFRSGPNKVIIRNNIATDNGFGIVGGGIH